MSGIQIFLLFVIWVPVAVTLIIMCCAFDCIYDDDDRKKSAQIAILTAVQLIAAILACVFHLLLLPAAIASVLIMIFAIILSNRRYPLRRKDIRKYFSAMREEKDDDDDQPSQPKKSHKKFWRWFLTIVALLALGYGTAYVAKNAFVLVNQGERGIKLSFGKVVQKSYGPGLVWYLPFSEDWGNKVVKVDVRPRNYAYNLSVRTKDVQRMSLDCSVLLQVVPDSVHVMYDKYTGYDDYEMKVVRDMVQSTMLALSSQMSFWSFVGNEVDLITEATEYIVNDQLMSENLVRIDKIWLNDYHGSAEMESLIEQTMQAKQRVDLEQFKLEQAKIKTEQVKLQAIQRYEMLAADENAKAIATKVESEATRNNPYIALYKFAKAWNGNLTLPETLMFMTGEGGGSGASVLPIIPLHK